MESIKESLKHDYNLAVDCFNNKDYISFFRNVRPAIEWICKLFIRDVVGKKIDYDDIVWCVNNSNTTLVTRRNGKVSIQGNCQGQAADIRTIEDTKTENKKLFDLAQKLKLPFDQLIDEHNLDWIHISYSNRNRRQVLTIK